VKTYYVGTHHPEWLWTPGPAFPMCVSRRSLARRKTLGRALVPWILDSGGYSELSKGTPPVTWSITPEQYVAEVARYAEEIGNLAWAAPMDHMCEPHVRRLTGKTVDEHQALTVESYLFLRLAWSYYSDLPCPFIPVLQGWSPGSYVRCWELYEQAGVDLAALPVAGVGSVCGRDSIIQISAVFAMLGELRLHGFGVKTAGLEYFGDALESADSMAWSLDARYKSPLPGHETRHKRCNNCRDKAAEWYEDLRLDRFGLTA
jgi:hypothetical protein